MCMLNQTATFSIGIQILLASWMQKGYTQERIDRARDYLEWRFRRDHGYAY